MNIVNHLINDLKHMFYKKNILFSIKLNHNNLKIIRHYKTTIYDGKITIYYKINKIIS